MKVYFAGSIRGGRDDQPVYEEFIQHLKDSEVVVLCEHVGYNELTDQGQNQNSKFIHDRDLDWIDKSQAVIAEVTNPSLGVGYEIRYAVDINKPVLVLFASTEKRLSAMIEGSSVEVFKYQRNIAGIGKAKQAITNFLKHVEDGNFN